jgi:CubicO group peptidase (beta-lactamase class C family)
MAEIDDPGLRDRVRAVLNRWPTAGLAVAVVRGGDLAWFYGHGVTDVTAGTPVTQDTVFRIDSITKTFTAVAVMQLCEQGLADLDAPASEYLRGYRLIPARAGFRPVTLRQLLTHTAGVRAVRTAVDLARPALGWGTPAGRPVPPLAEYYRGGLRIDIEPGTRWAYSNNGYATLGQIVEDISGLPLARYLRERIFGPLGMENSDLIRSERVRSRLATGYMLGRSGLRAVTDREIVQAGGGSIYASTADMARYAAALLGGGAGAHGAVLRPETLAGMFAPHYQPDPRIPGMGLGFFRAEAGGHRIVSHDGIWHGFHAAIMLAPDDGIGVLAFANTGPFTPLSAAGPAAGSVLRGLLGLPADVVRTDIPEHPWVWHRLCGWYSLGPGVLVDPQPRMLGGAEVTVRHGQLIIRGQIPVPAVRRGLRLYPDGDDPYAFRIGLPGYGSGTSPVVFSREPGGEVTALHLGALPMSFQKRPGSQNPRRWAAGALAAGAVTLAACRLHRRAAR